MTRSESSSLVPFIVLLAAAFGACHEPSGTSSLAPLNSAPLRSPAGTGSTPAVGLPTASGSSSESGVPSAAPALGVAVPVAVPNGAGGASSNPTPAGDVAPRLVDAEGKALPQTDQRPSLDAPGFRQRIAAVAQAIISGDAAAALDSFFPLVAYQQVKDTAKPERDYRFRLLGNFKRDVLEYHRALGSDAAQAKFVGIRVPEKDAKWLVPGSEGNKLGYFRVLRSRLHFTLPAGRSRDFELTSLISWRGEWYVVHLHGFK